MSQTPNEIGILTHSAYLESEDPTEARRGAARSKIASQMITVEAVDVTHFQQQVNLFITNLDKVMTDTPEAVGGFKLVEFEVSAAITVQGKGEIKLALIGGELSAGVNAGLKFVFRKSA